MLEQSFLRRHPEISKRKATAKNVAKLKNAKEKIEHWAQQLASVKKFGYFDDPSGIYNFDETPYKLAELHDVVYARKGTHTVPIYAHGSDREQITVLEGGTAEGRMCRPLILFSGACHVESRIIHSNEECLFAVNPSGTTDRKIWNQYFELEVMPSMTSEKVTF